MLTCLPMDCTDSASTPSRSMAAESALHRFEFPLELNMYRYTKEAMDAAEAAAGAAPGEPPQPSRPEQGPQASAAEPGAACTSAQDPNTQENCAYELRGIVVHSGTANAGHYYSYAKVGPAFRGDELRHAGCCAVLPGARRWRSPT